MEEVVAKLMHLSQAIGIEPAYRGNVSNCGAYAAHQLLDAIEEHFYRMEGITERDVETWINNFKGKHCNPQKMKENILIFLKTDDVDDKVLIGNQNKQDLESIQSSVAMFLYQGFEQGSLDFDPWTDLRDNMQKAREYIRTNMSLITPAAVEDAM